MSLLEKMKQSLEKLMYSSGKVFMNIVVIPNDKLRWYVIMHLIFVLSALFMGYLETITKH